MSPTEEKRKVKEALKQQATADELLDQLLEGLEPAELRELYSRIVETAADASPASRLAKRLQSREYGPKERAALEFATLCRFFEQRRKLLESSLTATQVGKLITSSRQTPHDRREAGTLLGVLDNGVWKFPIWQFDPQGPNGIVDGLADVLPALKVSDFAKVSWLSRPNPVLKTTPIEALKKGRKAAVLNEALGVGVV